MSHSEGSSKMNIRFHCAPLKFLFEFLRNSNNFFQMPIGAWKDSQWECIWTGWGCSHVSGDLFTGIQCMTGKSFPRNWGFLWSEVCLWGRCVNRTFWGDSQRAGRASFLGVGRWLLDLSSGRSPAAGERAEGVAELKRGVSAARLPPPHAAPIFLLPSRAGCSLPTPVTVATARTPPAPRLLRNRSVAAAAAAARCRTRCYCRCRRLRRLAWSCWLPRSAPPVPWTMKAPLKAWPEPARLAGEGQGGTSSQRDELASFPSLWSQRVPRTPLPLALPSTSAAAPLAEKIPARELGLLARLDRRPPVGNEGQRCVPCSSTTLRVTRWQALRSSSVLPPTFFSFPSPLPPAPSLAPVANRSGALMAAHPVLPASLASEHPQTEFPSLFTDQGASRAKECQSGRCEFVEMLEPWHLSLKTIMDLWLPLRALSPSPPPVLWSWTLPFFFNLPPSLSDECAPFFS